MHQPDKPPYDQSKLDQALAWLLRVRDNPDDAEIRQALSEWLTSNDAHHLAYRQAQAQWAWMEHFKEQRFRARDEALRYRPPGRYPTRERRAVYGATCADSQ